MNDIEQLIPQRAPMMMVDRFLGVNEGISETELSILPDNLFVTDGKLSECGILEHIAQSAAARTGYLYLQKRQPVPIGYIGSVDSFVLKRLPLAGETLHTSLQIVCELSDITMIEARSVTERGEVAGCRMKIFLEQ